MIQARNRFRSLLTAICLLAAQAEAKPLMLGDLPLPAEKTVREQAGTNAIVDIQQAADDGEIQYTVTVNKEGANRDLIVAEDGRLCSAEIPLQDVGSLARATIKKTVADGSLESVAISFGQGKFNYDVMMTNHDGVERSFTVELDGTISSKQIALDEAPFQVRAMVKTHLARLHGELKEIDWTDDADGVSYDVQIKSTDGPRDLSLLPTGRLDSVQVFETELPGAVRQTLTDHLDGGKLARIDQEFDDDGSFLYHVKTRKAGKISEFYIDPAGQFQATND